MNNKPKCLNLLIKNTDNKKSKSNIMYKSSLLSDKLNKNNNEYILSLKRAINPIFSNHIQKNKAEVVKPKVNNLLSNYIFSSNMQASNIPFNGEIKNHISLGDIINNKSDNPLKIKQKFKNLYSNKSESKLNIITNNKKLPLNNTFKNFNYFNQSKLYPNYSEKLFPILNKQSKKSENNIIKEYEININSTGNISNNKKSMRFNLIGNNIFENNTPKSNIFLKNNNLSSLKSDYGGQSPSSIALNYTKYNNDNNKKTITSRKQMFKILSDSKMKKNKITFKKLSLKLITPSYVNSDNNDNINKETLNKY